MKRKKMKTHLLPKNNQPVPQCLTKRKKKPIELSKRIRKSAQYPESFI